MAEVFTDEKLDKIKGKLEKLLRLQEGAEKIGSLEEAKNAAGQIQKLLLKYNLAMGDITPKDHNPVDDVNRGDFSFESLGRKKTSGKWIETLVFTIARYNLCRGVKVGDWGMAVLGLPHNLEVVTRHIHILIKQLPLMARESFKAYDGHEKRNTFIRGFLLGAVTGIRDTLIEQQNEMKALESEVTALVLTSDKLITEAVGLAFGKMRSAGRARSSSQEGRTRGYKAGRSIKY